MTDQTLETSDSAPGNVVDDKPAGATLAAPGEPEAAPAPEGAPAQEAAPDPAGYTKRIHQKHHELMEEKRKTADLEQQLQTLRAELPGEKRPVIPDLPEPYAENFEAQVRARDDAIRSAAEYDAQKVVIAGQKHAAEQAQAQQRNEVLQQAVTAYSTRAAQANISQKELEIAGQTVASYGIDDSLVEFILGDDKGPLITKYLAQNPNELDKLQQSSPIQAAAYIAATIKPKLGGQVANGATPPPADTLGGGGAPPSSAGLERITFR